MRRNRTAGWLLISAAVLAAGSAAAAKDAGFRPIDLSQPKLIYKARASADGGFDTYADTVVKTTVAGRDAYRIETGNGKTLIEADGYRPIRAEYFNDRGKRQGLVEYNGNSVTFDFPGNRQKTLNLSGTYYDCSQLYHLFRAFPFGADGKVVFTLVMDGRGGSPLGPRRMYVKEIGRERVETAAGVFDGNKLEMGVAGLAGLFAGRYKYYFWYAADERHYLLRYYDRETGALTELVEIEGE